MMKEPQMTDAVAHFVCEQLKVRCGVLT